jgi:hypothetical protein
MAWDEANAQLIANYGPYLVKVMPNGKVEQITQVEDPL